MMRVMEIWSPKPKGLMNASLPLLNLKTLQNIRIWQ